MKKVLTLGATLLLAGTLAHADVIKIGMSNDQTGPNKAAGRGIKVGVDAYLKSVNDRGGVNGNTFQLVNGDDQYVPDKTVDVLLKIIEEQKPVAFIGTVGTSNGVAAIPLAKEYKIPFVAPRSGAADFRKPVTREVINIRASHQDEVDKVVDKFVAEKGFKRFAVFYQNDTFGKDVLNCMEQALKRNNLTLVSKGSYERGTTAVKSALTAIMAGNPEVVFIGAVSAPGGAFMQEARKEGLKAVFATGSFGGGGSLIKVAGDAVAEGVVMSQVIPHLDDVSLAITKECKEAITKYPEDIGFNIISFEGCVSAKALVAAIEKAGKPVQPDAVIKAFEEMKGYDLGGIKLTFSPDNHQGQSEVWLSIVKGGKIVPLASLK
ncbi:MAG TPA: ABC transporter substrate-binding protein [Desulfuromonadaceae bacterium]|jgi:ABC-type branched-subunit amino acid transport system substrate-binding protein